MNFLTNLFKKNYLTSKIKQDLINGGLIIAPRRSGKSEAIIELLNESDDYIIVCINQDHAKSMRDRLIKRHIKNKVRADDLIVGQTYDFKRNEKKIIIEEFFYNKAADLNLDWHAAVSTLSKDVIVYNKKGKKLISKTEESFQRSEIKCFQ